MILDLQTLVLKLLDIIFMFSIYDIKQTSQLSNQCLNLPVKLEFKFDAVVAAETKLMPLVFEKKLVKVSSDGQNQLD